METSETSVGQESIVDSCIKKHGTLLISILQELQKYYNYLPVEALKILSAKLEMPLRDIYGVASFYTSFSFSPKGNHVLTFCYPWVLALF